MDFHTIYNDHGEYVARLSRRLARGDRDVANDLAQEAWFDVFSAPDGRLSDGKYVRTVITRAMHRWLRRERALQMVTLEKRAARVLRTRQYLLDFPRSTPRPHVQAVIHRLPSGRRRGT